MDKKPSMFLGYVEIKTTWLYFLLYYSTLQNRRRIIFRVICTARMKWTPNRRGRAFWTARPLVSPQKALKLNLVLEI
jgi:hypothetical protein